LKHGGKEEAEGTEKLADDLNILATIEFPPLHKLRVGISEKFFATFASSR
jgi:hypothetical protein